MVETPETLRSKKLLAAYKSESLGNLSNALDSNGVNIDTLSAVMQHFISSLIKLPEGCACEKGCAYCCHLRVGVSVPEAIVIFNQIKINMTDDCFTFFRSKIEQAFEKSACPFLAPDGHVCLIYDLRPFSCRAFHSTDISICKAGFEKKSPVEIPCFPLYRAFIDVHSTIFIEEMKRRNLFSYQVGFISALHLLFQNAAPFDFIGQWFDGKDVFKPAKLY